MVQNITSIPRNNAQPAVNGFGIILSDLRGESLNLVLRDHAGNEIERVGINRGDCLDAVSGGTYHYSRYEVVDIL